MLIGGAVLLELPQNQKKVALRKVTAVGTGVRKKGDAVARPLTWPEPGDHVVMDAGQPPSIPAGTHPLMDGAEGFHESHVWATMEVIFDDGLTA